MPEPISLESHVVATREQVSCELADEVVILNLRSGEYYGLDPVGARIWSLMQQVRSVGEIRDILLREFPDAEAEQCARDLVDLLNQLAEADLLEVRAPSQVPA